MQQDTNSLKRNENKCQWALPRDNWRKKLRARGAKLEGPGNNVSRILSYYNFL